MNERSFRLVTPGLLGLLGLMTAEAFCGEREIIAGIESFFATHDLDERIRLAREIETDEAYDPTRVGSWLHQADLFEPIAPGEKKINIPLDHGEFRTVLVRTPKDYTADRSWPMILMFHGSFAGVGEDWSLRVVKQLLGDRIEEFIIACPGNFAQDVIDSIGEPSVEHPAILLALKKMLNIDSDRVYVMGVSMGGYCCWTLATLYPDQFAGAVPMSSTFSMPTYVDGLWETMAPNVRHLPIINVWGDSDPLKMVQVMGMPKEATIPALNDVFIDLTRELELDNILFHEIPDRGHFPCFPPDEPFQALLDGKRVQTPRSVRHRFRYIYQSPAYWLEGHTWIGEQWLMDSFLFISLRDENEEKLRETSEWILDCLGELRGVQDGQSFDVHRSHVGEMTLWLMEGMVNWEAPIQVSVDDQSVFESKIEPDLAVCLSQAARTRDFDRLRWAGLRISAAGEAVPVTVQTVFPPLMEVEAYSKRGE